ncbi:nitroreductase family protein [Bacillus sp. SG-1]|uniref:nitroreductase family protein n=1 Tax=Bacillus sp. SG-1 TaxID=161544 RepID=UPI00015436AC|nr:nitroreductase family protein [Bacillus sp. SG-1]EDL65551.1 nitroreductase family protein [Bacillus sp. SG-1]
MALAVEMIKLQFERLGEKQQHEQLEQFLRGMKPRKEVKSFSKKDVPEEVVKRAILSAGTSPSGANQQPWSFILISDEKIKQIVKQELAEDQTIVETAPFLVALFKQKHGVEMNESGESVKVKHYYPNESAGICAGFFITALNQAGLHYNLHKPVKALTKILHRPDNEEPFMLFSIGIAEEEANSTVHRPGDHIVSDVDLVVPDSGDSRETPLSGDYYHSIRKRRNVRDFSIDGIDRTLIQKAFQSLESSPFPDSYRFAVITNTETKRLIREKAEQEEKKFYEEKITEEWRDVLKPLGTNWEKAHLTDAPFLIIGFKVNSSEGRETIYSHKTRPIISASVNTGILMSAIHHANLCMLTHTPSPMTFLRDLLKRPKNELPIVVLPVGYPAENCEVPNIGKKPLEEILTTMTEREGEAS